MKDRFWVLALLALATACGASEESDGAEPRQIAAPTVPATEETPEAPAPAPAPATTPTPPAAPAPDDYAKEKAWAEARGVAIASGKVVVVAKRRGADARSERYQDEILVFRADGKLERFVATTKPAQMPNPQGTIPDVDGNGRRDLGIVRPGVYESRGNEWFGLEGHERRAFRVYTKDGSTGLPAWRDTSGDGLFSAEEKAASERQNHRITGILIHYGFAPSGTKLGADTYVGPWSVGCQNVQYTELDRFVAAVGGAAATFPYAIVQD